MARIKDWETLLPLYTPGVLQYQMDNPDNATTSDHPEDHRLWLPSAVPQPHRSHVCLPGPIDCEQQLRLAQMSDALNGLRQILKIKSRMVQFKNKNLRGQRDGTRSRAIIDRVHERAKASATKYRVARASYLALSGPGEWEETYRILNDADIRGYQDPDAIRTRVGRRGIHEDGEAPVVQELGGGAEEDTLDLHNQTRERRDGTGETRRTLSWIWSVGKQVRRDVATAETEGQAISLSDNLEADESNPEDQTENDIFRVEWCKSRARALRATEEVTLLKEEMRRALAFLRWKGNWWLERRHARPGVSKDMLEGISAFATTQAEIQNSLANHFQKLWQAPLDLTFIAIDDDEENEGEHFDEDSDEEGEDTDMEDTE